MIGNIQFDFDWSWFALGTAGFLLGWVFQFWKYQPRIVRAGGWKISYFILDNYKRLIAGFVTNLILSQIAQDTNPWIFLAACAGLDRGIESFTNRKK